MKKRKVITNSNLSFKFPLSTALVIWFILKELNAPSFMFGVFGTIFFLIGLLCIYDWWNTENIDLFKKDDK